MPYYSDPNPYYGSSQPPPYYMSSSPYSPATSRISSPYSFSYMSPISAMLSASIGTNPLPRGLRSYSPMLSAISETSSSPLLPRRDITGHRNSPRHIPKTYFRQPRPVTIDTENIDLTKRKKTDYDEESTPGAITRGRTTVRMHTKKLKDNPLLKKKKTQAEILMEKYLIKDKPTSTEEDVPRRKRIWEEREEEQRNVPTRSGTIKRTNTIVKKNNSQLALPKDDQNSDVDLSSQRKMSTELLKAEAALFDCMIQEELGFNSQKEMDMEREVLEQGVDDASLKRKSKREQMPYVRIKSSHSIVLDENGLPITKRKSRALKKKSSKVLSLDEFNKSSDSVGDNNSTEETVHVKPKRKSTKEKKPLLFKIDTLHVEEKSSPKLLKKFNYEVIVEECNKTHDNSPCESKKTFNNVVQKDIPEFSSQEVLSVDSSENFVLSTDSPDDVESTRLSSNTCDNECDIIDLKFTKLEEEVDDKSVKIINQVTSYDMKAQNNVSNKKDDTIAPKKINHESKRVVKGYLQRQQATESNSQDQSLSQLPLDDLLKEKTDNLTNKYSNKEEKPKCLEKLIIGSRRSEGTSHKPLGSQDKVNLNLHTTKFDHSKSPVDIKNSFDRAKDIPVSLKPNSQSPFQPQDRVLCNKTSVLESNNKQLAHESSNENRNIVSTSGSVSQILLPKSAPTTPVLAKKVSSIESGNIIQNNKVFPKIIKITEDTKTLTSDVINSPSSTNNCSVIPKTQLSKNQTEDEKTITSLSSKGKQNEKITLLQKKGKTSELEQKFSNNTTPKSAPTTPILPKKPSGLIPTIQKNTCCSLVSQLDTTVNSNSKNEGELLDPIDQNSKTSTPKNILLESAVSARKKEEIGEKEKTSSKLLLDASPKNIKTNQSLLCENVKSEKTDSMKTPCLLKTKVSDSLINQRNTTGLPKSLAENNNLKSDSLNILTKNKEKVSHQTSDPITNKIGIMEVSPIISNKEPIQQPNIKNAGSKNFTNVNFRNELSKTDKNNSQLLKDETTSTSLLEIDSKSLEMKRLYDKTKALNVQSTEHEGKITEKLGESIKVQKNKMAETTLGKSNDANILLGKKELNKSVQKIYEKGAETKGTNTLSNCAKKKQTIETLNENTIKIAPKKTEDIIQIEKKPSVDIDVINPNKSKNKNTGSELVSKDKIKSPNIDGNKILLGKIGKIDRINVSLEQKETVSKSNAKVATATLSLAKPIKSDHSNEILKKDELLVQLNKGVDDQQNSKGSILDNGFEKAINQTILTLPNNLDFKESKENKLEMSQSKFGQNVLKGIKSESSDSNQLKQNQLISSNENTQVKTLFGHLGKECKKTNPLNQQLKTACDVNVDFKKDSKKKRIKSESDVPEDLDNDLNQNPIEKIIVKNEDEKKSKSLKEISTEKSSKKNKKSKDKKSSKEKKDSKSPKKLKDPVKSIGKSEKLDKKVGLVESQIKLSLETEKCQIQESSSTSGGDKENSDISDISTVELSKRSTRLMHFINKCVKLSSDNESLSVEISDEDLSTSSSSSEYTTDSECTSDSEESSTDESECDVNCHRKCEKLMPNLCGVNQKLIAEALSSLRKGSSSEHSSRDHGSPTRRQHNAALSLDEEKEQPARHHGRITPPATTIPKFRKYAMDDFQFLKVLGKGSFGKVLLAELRGTQYYYAVKCLKKDVVLEDDDVECTLIERKVLALGTNHPYLCHLFCTFQTDSHLFFVMEYLNGGDLMFHIQQQGRFDEGRARFYAAEIVSGLKFLHKKGIVYRDLKLDNILLDFDGHVRIADFGMCKLQIFLDRTADTFCGTPDYMAPEIIKGLKYNQCVDWWSFGILMYEMLVGQSPFSGCDEDDLFWCICNRQPHYPRFITMEAKRILTQLLEKEANKRLGSCENGAQEVMGHPFFNGLDWERLERRELVPPFKPNVKHPLDVHYFDKHFTAERACLTPIDPSILQSMDQTQFQGFSYTNPNVTE